MKAQSILGSPPFVLLGVLIARTIPRRAGYRLARYVARTMAKRQSHLYLTIRANLAQVVGLPCDASTLDVLAERAIYYAGRTYVDMFRTSVQDHRRHSPSVRIDDEEWARTKSLFADDQGTILIGPHMGNFDVAMQWFEAHGAEMLVLGLANPNAGTRVVNWLRRRRGVAVAPITMHSLRQALETLKRGGIVTTGVDRPVSSDDEPLQFFGAPAHLPTGHVRLALQAGARIVVAACIQEGDAYAIHIAPAVEMEITGNRAQNIQHNARRVLAVLEEMIRRCPEQWLMFVPVWPEEDASHCGSSP